MSNTTPQTKTFDYSRLLNSTTKEHVRQSCLAARYEEHDYVIIDSDRINSLFASTLSPEEYALFNWEEADEFLFAYAETILSQTPLYFA